MANKCATKLYYKKKKEKEDVFVVEVDYDWLMMLLVSCFYLLRFAFMH